MSGCFSLAERKPRIPAFAPARPAVQRKCACGGQCSSCRAKQNHGGHFGHNFGDINVHADAPARPAQSAFPVRVAEVANGDTGCDVSKGIPDIEIGQPSLCYKHCTERHEEVHKKDIGPCCKKANTAWSKAKDDKKDAVQDKMNDWVKANESWLQCRAYAESVACADEFMKANCGNKKTEAAQATPSQLNADAGMGDFPMNDAQQPADENSLSPSLLAEDKPGPGKQGDGKAADEKPAIDPALCCATVRDYRFHSNARREAHCKIAKRTPCPF
jgi:hypothetical protein